MNENRLELTQEQAEKVKFRICGHSPCSLSRKLQCKMGEVTDDIVVLQIQKHKKYVQDKKLKNIIENGIKIGNIEYQFYTSTASGQKERKLIFINKAKKGLIDELDCGLDDDLINQKGGIVISKLLAYRGLNLTGSEKWFDYESDLLNKIIVVPDFENTVIGEVDSVDEVTYEITRLIESIELNQTDGCGICLPEISDKALQIRAPWIKGVVAPFDFVRFIQEFNGNPIITDVFEQQHNVLDEEIKIILTESMLKMSGYYSSFDEYKAAFIKGKCEFSIAKQEPKNYSKKVELSYQCLQSLFQMSQKKFENIAKYTRKRLETIKSNKRNILSILGASPDKDDSELTAFQSAVRLYPELLDDAAIKRKIQELIHKRYEDAWCGRLTVDGSMLFVLPDLFAFCEHLFLGIDNPKGILCSREIYQDFYSSQKPNEIIDCIRYPHLGVDHYLERLNNSEMCRKWFIGNSIFANVHDLMSKVLMFDFDGDEIYILCQKDIIDESKKIRFNAEFQNGKNCRIKYDFVPLDFEPKKAGKQIIDSESITESLLLGFNVNIGKYSNALTKLYNGKDEIGSNERNIIRWLIMENNYEIDSVKTGFKPIRPKAVEKIITDKTGTKIKMPYFFQYNRKKNFSAKAKFQEKSNNNLNLLKDLIAESKYEHINVESGFDYNTLLNKSVAVPTEEQRQIIVTLYEQELKKFKLNEKKYENENSYNYRIAIFKKTIREKSGCSDEQILNVLLEYCYENNRLKRTSFLWDCFDETILNNLKNNLSNRSNRCQICGSFYEPKSNHQSVTCGCKSCSAEYDKIAKRVEYHKQKTA